MNTQSNHTEKFDVSFKEVLSLFIPLQNKGAAVKQFLYLVGIFLSPVTLFGALWGYIRAYYRHHYPKGELPRFDKLKPVTRIAMILGGLLIWFLLGFVTFILFIYGGEVLREKYFFLIVFLSSNLVFSIAIFFGFNRWRKKISSDVAEMKRFGNARLADKSDLADYFKSAGVYIGDLFYGYPKQGHYLTVAGTRSGKFVNLIAPNLLGMGGYEGSKVVIDVKGEIAHVTGRFQHESGQTVLILDPWNVIGFSDATYNPLDLLINAQTTEHLSDDASMIAEMIVPKSVKGDQFFTNRARSMITGLIMHLVTSQPQTHRHLGMLWKWLRLGDEDWINLVADMSVSKNAIVQAVANEIVSVYNRSEKTFASILSTAQDCTDFLKSPSLQKSLASSNFDINSLSSGKTTLYVVIPPQYLQSQYQWLRLVVTTAMRAVVRNRKRNVLFVLDEFAALGYLPEIETALSTYAGYNISIWAIIQDLGQLKKHYGDSWETFISNSAVRHFFGVNDKFTAEYLSDMFGETTYITYEDDGSNGSKARGTARKLLTPDEIRRGSENNIFTLIDQKPVAVFQKKPYYDIPFLIVRYDPNPYYNLAVPNSEMKDGMNMDFGNATKYNRPPYFASKTNGTCYTSHYSS